MLTLNIKKHGYQEKVVLKNIQHTFLENKIYGIIGPNGSGKSTLLKLIAAIEKPLEGEIIYQGNLLTQPSDKIGCCWQKPYLFRGTVRYNLEYPMKVRRWDRQRREQRIRELIEDYHLEQLINRSVIGLSGGETARVAIARAVATCPDVLILDEPSAALDPQSVMFVESLLKKLRNATKMTIIMVTHNMFQAKRIADDTLFLFDGSIVEAGATSDIFENPQDIRTRNFVTGEYVF